MTQIHNIIKNEKNNYIKYGLQDLEINENDTVKMYEAVKKSNDWHSQKNRLSKQKKDLPQNKKSSQKS